MEVGEEPGSGGGSVLALVPHPAPAGPVTRILGPPQVEVRPGGGVTLECLVTHPYNTQAGCPVLLFKILEPKCPFDFSFQAL